MTLNNFMGHENRVYLDSMLKKGWRVYIYKVKGELVPTGVMWHSYRPVFIVKPKQNNKEQK